MAGPGARTWPIVVLAGVLSVSPTHAVQSGGAADGPAATPGPASIVDQAHLERAHRRIVEVSATLGREVSLAELLSRLTRASREENAGSLVDEQRATLVALAFYVNRWSLEWVAPDARTWPRAEPRRVMLNGRRDHARHFVVSAAMAAVAGTSLADAVALYKELSDSQGGSGFSFPDVAANRAGQRFGTLATASPESAVRLAARLARPLRDDDLMPDTAGLPDGLNADAFRQQYGAVGSNRFNALVDDIDTRIAALSLYR